MIASVINGLFDRDVIYTEFDSIPVRELVCVRVVGKMAFKLINETLNCTDFDTLMKNSSSATDAESESATSSIDSSTVATITELVVKNLYIMLGSVGTASNLFVIIIIICYTDLTQKVMLLALI